MQNSYKKGFFRLSSYILILSLLLTSGFFSTLAISATKAKVSSIKVKNVKAKKLNLFTGDYVKLNVTVNVKPNTAANKKLSYKSTNKKYVSVTSAGKVKGLKAGSAKVIVTSKVNPKKFVAITVKVKKKVSITSLKLNQTSLQLYDDDDDTELKVSISPKNASIKELIWSSSNENVADVDEDGFVTPYSTGTATIKVMATDGSKKFATCKVTVLSSDDDSNDDPNDDSNDDPDGDSDDDPDGDSNDSNE